jgi:hypothetical protein
MVEDTGEHGQPYAAMISDLKARRDRLSSEIQRLENAITALEALSSGSEVSVNDQGNGVVAGNEPVIRVGEFHGLPIPVAARMILEKTNRHPLKTSDILRLLEKSGRKIEAKIPTGNIYSSLKRNPDFELVAPNTWGLTEWYPGAKRKTPKPSVAAKVEEIMKRGTMSLSEATKQAEREIAATEEENEGDDSGKASA